MTISCSTRSRSTEASNSATRSCSRVRTRAWISGNRAAHLGHEHRQPRATLLEEITEARALAQAHGAELVERLLEQRAGRA
jgi:hypothetical protein